MRHTHRLRILVVCRKGSQKEIGRRVMGRSCIVLGRSHRSFWVFQKFTYLLSIILGVENLGHVRIAEHITCGSCIWHATNVDRRDQVVIMIIIMFPIWQSKSATVRLSRHAISSLKILILLLLQGQVGGNDLSKSSIFVLWNSSALSNWTSVPSMHTFLRPGYRIFQGLMGSCQRSMRLVLTVLIKRKFKWLPIRVGWSWISTVQKSRSRLLIYKNIFPLEAFFYVKSNGPVRKRLNLSEQLV